MRTRPLRSALLGAGAAVALLLGACHRDDSASGGDTPEAAVMSSVRLIKAGDFAGFWKHALPPADFANLRADWTRRGADPRPLTEQDRQRFQQTMQKLTAPNAENTLYAEVQPKLADAQTKFHDQLPLLVGVGQQMARNAVVQSPTLSPPQKSQADAVINVLGPWAQQAPWFDQAKAKQAVATVVTTARKLDLKSADQLRTMDFDTAMAKYGTGFDGVRQFLTLYGLSIDQTLDSVKVTTVKTEGDTAQARIDYTLLGKPLSTASTLVKENGRWYSQDLLTKAREAHRQALAPPAPPQAPAVPAAPSGNAAPN